MPCAAPATAAATISVCLSLRVCCLTTSLHWMNTINCLIKITGGGRMEKHMLNLKVTRAIPVCAPQTAQRGTAAPDTSGQRSVNQCWGWERCAPSRGRKALTGWRSSNAVTVPRASPVRCGKTPPPHPSPGSTCARRYEAAVEDFKYEDGLRLEEIQNQRQDHGCIHKNRMKDSKMATLISTLKRGRPSWNQ